ncbi:hypothetical protein [Streptomyces sp. NPDC004376]
MPAHPRVFEHLAQQLAATPDPHARDALLDQWIDLRDRVTEWDADQWNLNPDLWCLPERTEMDRRARQEPTS